MDVWNDYFSERYVRVKGDVTEVWKKAERGSLQGSVSGPVMWNLMMDVLLRELERNDCEIVAYADDLLLLVRENNRRHLEESGTRWMRIVHEWGETMRYCIRLGETSLEPVMKVKYLGIRIREGMTFKEHLLEVRKKICVVTGKLGRVARREWGLGKKALRVIYKGMITACALYGVSVCSEVLEKGYGRRMLEGCERVVWMLKGMPDYID